MEERPFWLGVGTSAENAPISPLENIELFPGYREFTALLLNPTSKKALDILRAQTYILVVSFVKVVCNLSGGNAIG